MSNPLVAQRQDSTTWHSGINVIDDAAGVYDGVQSGSWVDAGIAAVGAGLDLLTMAMNPVGTLISYGLNWLIEHVQPLKDALDKLAGDADQIAAYSQTWKNIAKAVGQSAKDLASTVQKDTANWTGAGADAYRANIKNKLDHINAAATCAETIGAVVQVVGVLTGAVRGLVRDMVTQAIGDFVQDALEEVFSLGLGTPVVVAQVVEQVSQWMEKIGAVIKKLINSVEKLRPLMSKLEEIFAAIKKVMSELHGRPGEAEPHASAGEGSTHASAAEDVPAAHDGSAGEPRTSESTSDSSSTSAGDEGAVPAGGDRGGTAPDSATAPDRVSEHNDPATDSTASGDTPAAGDPVDLATGRMLLDQTDVELPGALPLVLARTHRSDHRVGRWFGRTWASTFDQRIEIEADAVHFAAADGMLLKYPLPADTGEPVLPVQGTPWPLARTADGYTIENPRLGQILHFGATGGATLPIRAITDRNGNRVDFVHDEDGVITAVRHSGGYHIAVVTEGGLVTELRSVTPHERDVVLAQYHYDSARRLREVVNSSGRPLVFDYDAAGRVTRWEDRNGMWYRFTYDEEGRCVRGEGKGNRLSYTFAYDRENMVTRATNSLGHTTVYELDERFRIVRETDPLGGVTTSEWDRHHRLLSRTDAVGRTVRCTYDERGNLAEFTRPDGALLRTEHNAFGLPTRVSEPDGGVWRQEYDERGNRVAVTDPAGTHTTYTYDERGNLASVTDALGRTATTRFDAAGRLVATTDPTGAVTRYDRDRFGRVSAITDPTGAVTTFTWTVEGKPLTRTLPDGATERWSYDGEGNTVRRTDALGRSTITEVTEFDLPSAEIAPGGARTDFTYDTELRPLTVTNPQGLIWRYEYDACGRLVRETDFDGHMVSYSRDAAGQLVTRTNGAGQQVRYRHDPMGNVVEQWADDVRTTFAYDALGRLLRATNPDADAVFERDLLGRVVAETVNGDTVASTYDVLGRRIRRTTPSGVDSAWEYDAADRPVTLDTAGRTVRFGHDAAGREVERSFGAATLTQLWDANSRLKVQALTAGTADAATKLVQRRSYRYRPDGYLVGLVDQLGGPRDFDLDADGRVTGVRAPELVERYGYDHAGNVTGAEWQAAPGQEPEAMGAREYAGTLVRRAGNVHYQHDAQGRVVLRRRTRLSRKPEIWHYTWDADDQLIALTTPDGQRWRYLYDGLGRRIAKQRLTPDGIGVVEEVRFHWDDTNLAEQSTTGGAPGQRGSTTWDYEPGGFRPVRQIERSMSRDTPQARIDERFYAIVTDLVGTPTELVDDSGALAWRFHQTVWGMRAAPVSGGVSCPLRFPGQYHDEESLLNYNYHRYYDPSVGRYHSGDPLGLEGGPNPGAYVPNPMAWTDPLGLQKCPLGEYADSLRGENQAATPRVAAEYTSPSGTKYYGHSSEGTPIPDVMKNEMEKIAPVGGRHGACAEVNAMSKAVAAEGPDALRGGSMRAVRVRSVLSEGNAHGTPIDPCPSYCQPLLRAFGISW